MPICYKCGKTLSTNQALNYHTKICTVNTNIPHSSSSNNISFDCDYSGTIIEINDYGKNLLVGDGVNIIGRNGYEFIYPDDKEYLYKLHIQFMATKIPQACVYRRINFKNEQIPVNSTTTLSDTSSLTFKVSENEIISHKLLSSRAIFICNLHGKIEYINNFAKNIYDYSTSVCGKTLKYGIIENNNLFYRDIKNIQHNVTHWEQCMRKANGKLFEIEATIHKYPTFILIIEHILNSDIINADNHNLLEFIQKIPSITSSS